MIEEKTVLGVGYKALPNVLTIARGLLPFSFVLFRQQSSWAVAALFFIASLTDGLDGFLARRWKCESVFGSHADPLADKLLVAAGLGLILRYHAYHPILLFLASSTLLREVAVTLLRRYLWQQGLALPASKWAKLKTVLQCIGLGILLAPLSQWVKMGTIVLFLSNLLAWHSCFSYVYNVFGRLHSLNEAKRKENSLFRH